MEIKGNKKSLPSGATLYVVPAKFIESYDFMGALLGSMEGKLSPAMLDTDEYREMFSNIRYIKVLHRYKAAGIYLEMPGVLPLSRDRMEK